ncbi:hypothetical protein K435DRAFT_107423 [Dendrothele bispora CBS 962.96]|uniref:Uncharacterized protein n=1 Tax=Dendrothele bispora (strain CBS 962.96) TaxID=1314807 RepID=A0A4S8MQX8_DENBC|nr:hypothetical protein K435DRAFT_107423 [Dendrothele bispora CBS 962.96]
MLLVLAVVSAKDCRRSTSSKSTFTFIDEVLNGLNCFPGGPFFFFSKHFPSARYSSRSFGLNFGLDCPVFLAKLGRWGCTLPKKSRNSSFKVLGPRPRGRCFERASATSSQLEISGCNSRLYSSDRIDLLKPFHSRYTRFLQFSRFGNNDQYPLAVSQCSWWGSSISTIQPTNHQDSKNTHSLLLY